MEPTRSPSCWQCGTVLPGDGGRCTACGAEQVVRGSAALQAPPTSASLPEHSSPLEHAPLPVRSSLGPRPPLHSPEQEARAKAIPWVVLGIGLLAILFLGALLAPRRSTEAASTTPSVASPAVTPTAAPPPDPNDLRLGDLSRVDPTDVLVRAKARALGWNRDALLVSMRAQPVLDGRVNLTSGGTIEYVFGKPTGEGFGAGARVSGKRFRISLTGTGSALDEVPGAVGRAALEPNCPLDEAARKAQAAGLPASAPVSVVYELNDKHPKPVWRVSSAAQTGRAETRLIDGWTCAILVR